MHHVTRSCAIVVTRVPQTRFTPLFAGSRCVSSTSHNARDRPHLTIERSPAGTQGHGDGVYEPRPLPATLRRRVEPYRADDDNNSNNKKDPRHASTSSSYTQPPSVSAATTVPEAAESRFFAQPLPDAPYGLPEAPLFEAERLGRFQKHWLASVVPSWRDQVAQSRYLPSKDDFWASPAHEALFELAARGQPYHDSLKMIMEHSYLFLFDAVMLAEDAPLPHVMYEDFMKCLTFASLQNAPEDQFALPTRVLKHLLCMSACTCTTDKYYFTSARQLFRRMEQQQPHMGSELLSAFVYVCTAAGQIDMALDYAHYMSRNGIRFDGEVFAFMMHPSVNVVQVLQGNVPTVAKGLVVQQRLCARLQASTPVITTTTSTTTSTSTASDGSSEDGLTVRQQQQQQDTTTASVALHAMFVYHVLTMQHAKKWELLHRAAQPARLVPMLPRTRQLAVSMYASEKGIRCGPRSTKALVADLVRAAGAEPSVVADLLYVLLRTRMNEGLPALAGLPRTSFTDAFEYTSDAATRGVSGEGRAEAQDEEDDAAFVRRRVRRATQRQKQFQQQAPSQAAVATPLIEALLSDHESIKDSASVANDGVAAVVAADKDPLIWSVRDGHSPSSRGPKAVLTALKTCAQADSPWPDAAPAARELLDRIADLDGLAAAQEKSRQANGARATGTASLDTVAAMAEKSARTASRRVAQLEATPVATHVHMDSADVVARGDAVVVHQLREEAESWRELLALLDRARHDASLTGTSTPSAVPRSSHVSENVGDATLQYYAQQQAQEQQRDDFVASFASQAWIDPSAGRDFSN